MNRLLQIYRQEKPEDTRDDATILLDLAQRFPDILPSFPDAVAELDQIRARSIEPEAPGALDYAKQVSGSVVRGLAGTLAQTPEAIAIGGSNLKRVVLDKTGFDLGDEEDPTNTGSWKMAEWIRGVGDKIAPQEDDRLKKSFWATTVPDAVGSAAGFLLGGGIARKLMQGGAQAAATSLLEKAAVKAVEAAPIAGLGAASAGASAWQEAKAAGASDEDAFKVFLLNAGVGTSEVLPLSRMLGRLDGISGGKLSKALVGAVKESFEEAVQEAAQQFAGNLIARKYYDKDRQLLDDLGQNAGAGAVTGALFSLLTHAIGAKVGHGHEAQASEQPATQEPTAINPVEQYRLGEPEQAKVSNILRREMAGDRSLELETALAGIYSNPEEHAFYTLEKQRLSEAAAAQEKAESPPVAPDAIPTEPAPVPAQVAEAPVEYSPMDQGGGLPAEAAPEPGKLTAAEARLAEMLRRAREQATAGLSEAETVSAEASPYEQLLAAHRAKARDAQAKAAQVAAQVPAPPAPAPAPEVVAPTPAPAAIEPVWMKLGAPTEALTSRIGFDTAQLQAQEKKGAGLGQKRAEAFVETHDSAELYKDVTANASDRKLSRKLGVFLSEDGSHVMVGTAYENAGRRYVTSFDGEGKPKATQYKNLKGYQLIASIKTEEPTRDYVVTYSADKWKAIAEDSRVRKEAARATAAAMEEKLRQAEFHAKEQGAVEADSAVEGARDAAQELESLTNGDDSVEAGPVAESVVEVRGFTEDHAGAIYAAITGAQPADLASIEGFADLLRTNKRALRALSRAMKALCDAGIAPNKALELLHDRVYEVYTSGLGTSREAFTGSLLQSISRARSENPARSGNGNPDNGPASSSPETGSGGQGTEARANASSQAQGEAATGQTQVAQASPDAAAITQTLGLELSQNGQAVHSQDGGAPVSARFGPNAGADKVYVADLIDPKTRLFRRHQALLGFDSREAALAALLQDNTANSLGELTSMPREDFSDWVNEGGAQNGPLAYGKNFKASQRLIYRLRPEGRTLADRVAAQPRLSSGLPESFLNPDTGRLETPEVLVANRQAVDLVYGSLPPRERSLLDPTTGATLEQFIAQYEPGKGAGHVLARIAGVIENTASVSAAEGARLTAYSKLATLLSAKTGATIEFLDRDPAATVDPQNGQRDYSLGLYENGHIQIFVGEHTDAASLYKTILHEAVHSVTADQLARFEAGEKLSHAETQAVLELRAIFERVRQQGGGSQYGFSNLHEFVAEAMTNPDFQRHLAAHQSEVAGQKQSLWQRFIEAVRKVVSTLLGVSPESAAGTELEAAINSVTTLIEQSNPDAAFTGSLASRGGGRQVERVSDPRTEVSPDLDSAALATRDVSAQNAVQDVLELLYKAWNHYGHNLAGISFEGWLASHNFVSLETTPKELIEDINRHLAGAGHPTVNTDLKLADVPADSMRKRAAAVAHRILSEVWVTMGERRRSAESALSARNPGNLVDRLSRGNVELHDLLKDYTDLDKVLSLTKRQVGALLAVMRERAQTIGEESHRAGQLEQVVKDLEGRMDKPLASQYEKAINRLYSRFSGDADSSRRFGDLLQAVARIQVDWESDSTVSIRDAIKVLAAGDPLLRPLVDPSLDSKALLSIVIAFGKSNAHVMDLLQLRKSNALEERKVVNEALRRALEEHERAFDEARDLVKDLPRLGKTAERLLAKVKKAKAANHELLDQIQRERTFIDFHQDSAPILRTEMAKLEAMIGAASQDWEPTHGQTYLVPPRPGATILQVEACRKTLSLEAQGTLSAQVRADLAKMREWLDSVPQAERGATWGTVNAQYTKLSMHDIQWGVHDWSTTINLPH